MESSELELFTTQELIAELMRRKTFLGVVVQSEQEMKEPNWGETRTFRVHHNSNLTGPEAGRLLDRIAEHISLYL